MLVIANQCKSVVSAFNNAGEYYGYGDISPSQFDYNVFVSLWTLLVLVYLIGILFVFKESQFAHPIISIALDGVTWVFWLAAFACVAALLNGVTDAGEFSALVAFGVLEWYAMLCSIPNLISAS